MVKKKPIKTIEIELALANFFGIRTHIIVPNISWGFYGHHEMDLFVVTPSNYVYEVEIKISKSDFLKDFEKKHKHESNYVREFYYAMPKDLYDKINDMIPVHAGVIICERRNKLHGKQHDVSAKIIKKPKVNTKSIKLNDKDLFKITRLGTMRIWAGKKNIIAQQELITELKNK